MGSTSETAATRTANTDTKAETEADTDSGGATEAETDTPDRANETVSVTVVVRSSDAE